MPKRKKSSSNQTKKRTKKATKFKTLYHGSNRRLKTLQPRPSQIIDKEAAVFATQYPFLAVAFIAKWGDTEIELGFVNGRPYIFERKPNAFKVLRNTKGYLYEVSGKGFHNDSRLGMPKSEFICDTSVKIKKTTQIKNIFKFLQTAPIDIIHYETFQKIKKHLK